LIVTILIFAIVLSVLVLAHELGHFFTAKWFKVTVKELGIGFPPRLLRFRRKDTDYTINAIPLGGFVRLVGEENPNEPGGLAQRPRWQRALVIAAGALINLAIPVLIFGALGAIPADMPVADVYVAQVNVSSPAAEAGVQAGDRIVRVDGRDVRSPGEVFHYMTLNLGSETDVVLERDGQQKTVRMRPRWDPPAGQGATGIVIDYRNIRTETVSAPVWEAPWLGVQKTWEVLVIAKNEVTRWIIGASAPQMAGPIGIAQMTGEVAGLGIRPLLEFIALLSLNLGIMNLLPLPMLDGGRLAFLGIETLRGGKRISPRVESAVHFVGFVMLMGLIILISYFDIIRLITGGSVVP